MRLPELFTLEATSLIVPPIQPQVSNVKIPLHYQDKRNNGSDETSGIMFNTTACQAPLFSPSMLNLIEFNMAFGLS